MGSGLGLGPIRVHCSSGRIVSLVLRDGFGEGAPCCMGVEGGWPAVMDKNRMIMQLWGWGRGEIILHRLIKNPLTGPG